MDPILNPVGKHKYAGIAAVLGLYSLNIQMKMYYIKIKSYFVKVMKVREKGKTSADCNAPTASAAPVLPAVDIQMINYSQHLSYKYSLSYFHRTGSQRAGRWKMTRAV